MIDDHGIIDLTEKVIGVRHLFLKWALWAQWIDNNKAEQKYTTLLVGTKRLNIEGEVSTNFAITLANFI